MSTHQQPLYHIYDAGPYRRRIRYRQAEPVPPSETEARQWAARLLDGLTG